MDTSKQQPDYIMWFEPDFWADRHVVRMQPLQRALYRTLLQSAFWCSTRPDLPKNDDQLCQLADAESPEVWLQNKDVVLAKFFSDTVDGQTVWAHKRLRKEWQIFIDSVQRNRERASKGGRAKAAKAASSMPEAGASMLAGATDTETPTANPNSSPTATATASSTTDTNTAPEARPSSGSGSEAVSSTKRESVSGESVSGFGAQEPSRLDRNAERAAKGEFCLYWDTINGITEPYDLCATNPDELAPLLRLDSILIILEVVRWAHEKSDFWFKNEKGTVDGLRGLVNAYPAMKKNYESYQSTIQKRLAKKAAKKGVR
jgi:uncharacterized protein YdaU (DUF1376 family)